MAMDAKERSIALGPKKSARTRQRSAENHVTEGQGEEELQRAVRHFVMDPTRLNPPGTRGKFRVSAKPKTARPIR